MEVTLGELIEQRLAEDAVEPFTRDLILAAVVGKAALERALKGEDNGNHSSSVVHLPVRPAQAYLRELSVQGFRGIGPRTSLELEPGPGLTLVVGRNGSGKSSFAEGLEVLLTGDSQRWAERSAAWKEGWRNLHQQGPVVVEARFAVEGTRGVTVRRYWGENARQVGEGSIEVQGGAHDRAGLEILGWDRALQIHRPFLSYDELGSMFDDPSDLYDALSSVLGLEELVEGQKRLAEVRRERQRQIEQAERRLGQLVPRLETLDDERALRCLAALRRVPWDLDALESILLGSATTSEEENGAEAVLRGLATLVPPPVEQVVAAADDLVRAATALAATVGTDAEHANRTAELLQRALDLHAAHGDGDCPVCGCEGALDHTWRISAEVRVRELRKRARAVAEAEQLGRKSRECARGLRSAPPEILGRAQSVGVDVSEAVAAWTAWHTASDPDLEILAERLLSSYQDLETALARVRDTARRELDRRESAWRPLAHDLLEWLGPAREARDAQAMIPRLKRAEQWLAATSGELRDRRFQPIADQAVAIWEQVRCRSHIDLVRPALEGQSTRRRVRLEVRVDGQPGTAVGVMSQGELHALALALFLPRALLPDSPFGFVVIDDPVQSMDPARVDGLARVLEDTAKRRQVVVFTHDDRLSEAVRRLRVRARILEVTRRPNSQVEVVEQLEPVERLLEDARVVALDENLPTGVAARVVPGLCREAVEAACVQVVRRRRIGRGEPHAQVEAELERARNTRQLLALALLDDRGRAGEVRERLGQRFGDEAAQLLRLLNDATHHGHSRSLVSLMEATKQLVTRLRELS